MFCTGGWTTWTTASINLTLKQGYNEIRFVSLTSDGAPNLDLLSFTSSQLSAGNCDATGVFIGQNKQNVLHARIIGDKLLLSNFDKTTAVRIVDLQGKILLQTQPASEVLSLNKLNKGFFVVQIFKNGSLYQQIKSVHL